MSELICSICNQSVPDTEWSNHIAMHSQQTGVVSGDGGVKRLTHAANAWEGISEEDQLVMRNLKLVRGRQRQFINDLVRRRIAPKAADVFATPSPQQYFPESLPDFQYNPPAPPYTPPPVVPPAPQVVTKYLCATCQGELVPGVQHVCPNKGPQANPMAR